MQSTKLNILQVLPNLISGGVEVGTIDIAQAIVCQGHNAIVISNGGPLVKKLEGIGASHITLPVHSKNPITMWKNARILKNLFQEKDISIIHARSRAPAWSCYWASKGLYRKRFLTSFHGAYGHHNKIKRWYNAVMLSGEKTIAVSNFIAQHIQEIYPNRAKSIHTIPRGIDTNKYDPTLEAESDIAKLKQRWLVPEDHTVIMLPGRITRLKGHIVLIKAIAALKLEKHVCLFVGDDSGKPEYRKQLDRLITHYDLEQTIRFVGPCENMEIAYSLASIVVSASTKPESFGRVACEAQAMNCLVIATNHGGSKETIAPTQKQFLCEPNDVESLSNALKVSMSVGVTEKKQICESSRAFIVGHFSLAQMCKDTLSLYSDMNENALKSETASNARN